MKILVTGAAGEVAPGVVRALARHNQHRLLDQSRGDELSAAEWVIGSILDTDLLARALEGVEAVVHLAIAKESAGRKPDTEEFFDVNVKGLYLLLAAAQAGGARCFVHIGSTAPVIGHWYEGRNITVNSPYTTRGRYSLTKALQELVCEHFARNTELRVVVLRPWSPCDASGGTVPAEYSPGLIDGEDVGEACRLAIEATELGDFEVFHIVATAEARKRFDADRTEKLLGFRAKLDFGDLAAGAGE